jgi:peptidoglycan/xylan/chitin deacetylase (PgdA/CDA1 family)
MLCVRIDLDYVPWDTPDATEFGHGEPAVLLRLLDLAKQRGYKFHFFASNRTLRAFPANAEAILNEGHDLDWFCKHPEAADERFQNAIALFSLHGHVPLGMCIRGSWPAHNPTFDGVEELKFLSAHPGVYPSNLILFPVETRGMREGVRGGITSRGWCDAIKIHMREGATRDRLVTIVLRPQVLAKHDPKLTYVREILELAPAIGMPLTTLRDRLKALAQPSGHS